MGPIVFCPNGHVFESRQFRIENSLGVVLRGNREPCPACGTMAELMDGEFDFIDGVITVLSAPAITRERLESLKGLFDAVRRGETSAAQAVAAVAEDPALEGLKKFMPQNATDLGTYVLVLIGIITVLLMLRPAPGVDHEKLTETVVKAVIAGEHQSPPPTAQPAPPTTQPPRLQDRPDGQ